ncbi:single-stranded-DNA-specific exonuclease RecJ [Sporomusa termitida]|uniref:Single-stranded-DNA-specific exonuclease RecJ n=1 Tax=Sporomusa termitida TaxID=2377 RepID=A0A517DU25_9FIRM|nr:single-stranded-DNA-specific exonuclease RecJ [Sporomusa termitida]QDR80849.1 recJ: single-stranded-DNA-specific exonuclease RecJ [Sporomusa termitida]
MARLRKVWRLLPVKPELASELSRKLNISKFIAQALINRGVTNETAATEFLHAGTEYITDPYLLKGMQTAVIRIRRAIDQQEKITVYGDYDVDGITACAIVYKTLTRLGAAVEYYIPDRQSEGYGLNDAALTNLIATGTKLVITVDCGVSAVQEVLAAAGKLDIVITDHHQPPPELPAAVAIINPKQTDCMYPEKNLAGVGVAFKLCQALWQYYNRTDSTFHDYLDIVAIGTIADIVPLTGENRVLVKTGLTQLAATENTGITALLAVCGLAGKPVDSGSVGFVVAPRLNAVGRVSQAAAGVDLLTTDDPDKARKLATLLDEENAARQAIEKTILAKAEEQLATMDTAQAKVLVLAGEEWHSGVIGIVASRLVERYYKPVVMISIREGCGKGSCRSIPAFDMYEALTQCSDLLTQFGGHRQAAGLTVPAENIAGLRERLAAIAAASLSAADYIPVLKIDSCVPLTEITAAFIEQLTCLEPYGFGNPSPVFACRNIQLGEKRLVGQQGRHLKLKLNHVAVNDVIAWNQGELADSLACNNDIDLVFVPKYNEWQGQKKLQLTAHDVRPSNAGAAKEILDKIAPDRDCIKFVYLTVKECNKQGHTRLSAADIAKAVFKNYKCVIPEHVIGMAITVLTELGLLSLQLQNDSAPELIIEPAPAKKLELTDSAAFRESQRIRQEYLAQHI